MRSSLVGVDANVVIGATRKKELISNRKYFIRVSKNEYGRYSTNKRGIT